MAKSKFSLVGKITLSSIVIYCLALSALESLVVVYHHAFVVKFILTPQGKGISDSDLIYHGIFFLSLIYQVAFCVYSLITRNSIQLMALVVFNILSLAYAGVQIYQHIILEEEGTIGAEFKPDDKFETPEDARDFFVKRMRPIEYIIASLVLIFSIYLSFLSYKLTKEFGWENYKTYTADLKVRKAYVSLTILQTLVKLDIFFIITYAIQLVPSKLIGYSRSIFETVLVFVIGFLLSSLAWYSDDTIDPYQFTRRLLTFTLSVTFILVCATIYYGIICFRNMTRGIYIYTVYGLPGSKNDNNISPDEIRRSKRASKKAELVRTSTAISLD